MPKVTYGKDLLLEKNKKQAAHVIKYCKDKKRIECRRARNKARYVKEYC